MVRKRSCFGVRYQFRSAQNLQEMVRLLMEIKPVSAATKTAGGGSTSHEKKACFSGQ